jgi:hypothetical protein
MYLPEQPGKSPPEIEGVPNGTQTLTIHAPPATQERHPAPPSDLDRHMRCLRFGASTPGSTGGRHAADLCRLQHKSAHRTGLTATIALQHR